MLAKAKAAFRAQIRPYCWTRGRGGWRGGRLGLVDARNMQIAIGDLTSFKLWLRHPGQNVVITANVGHEMHRLTASGVAVTRFAVPLLLRQTRQHF